jgi:hypothetical protein
MYFQTWLQEKGNQAGGNKKAPEATASGAEKTAKRERLLRHVLGAVGFQRT